MENCGKDSHPHELYLALGHIEHRKTRVGRLQTDGFVEGFNRTALGEFFRKSFRQKFYTSVEAPQGGLRSGAEVPQRGAPAPGPPERGQAPERHHKQIC